MILSEIVNVIEMLSVVEIHCCCTDDDECDDYDDDCGCYCDGIDRGVGRDFLWTMIDCKIFCGYDHDFWYGGGHLFRVFSGAVDRNLLAVIVGMA